MSLIQNVSREFINEVQQKYCLTHKERENILPEPDAKLLKNRYHS
jgi:hypothetical protein